jgi:lambda family phage minor tail protein L
MGKGQDKIARNLMDLQPTAIVELFRLFFNTVDSPGQYVSFHGGSLFGNDIIWQGLPYSPIPVETEGFEINGNGQVPRPKIRVANKDYFVTKLLTENNDFLHAKLIRKRTFVKYLDDANFDGGNPWEEADSSAELSNDTFLFSQKTAENKSFVEFELTSPLDVEGFDLTNRLVLARYCPWRYRGAGCNYVGIPIETEDLQPITINDPQIIANWTSNVKNYPNFKEWTIDNQYTSGDLVSITNSGVRINQVNLGNERLFYQDWFFCKTDHFSNAINKPDGTNGFWLKDGCSKKLSACRKRFNNDIGANASTITTTYVRSYIDFSPLYQNPSNNVASSWNYVSGLPNEQVSNPPDYHPFVSAVDGNVASDSNPYGTYWSATTAGKGTFYLNNFTGAVGKLDTVNVDRINVYNVYKGLNRFGTSVNISLTGNGGSVSNNVVTQIIDGGTTGRFTLLTGTPFTNMSGVSITSLAANVGIASLDQIEILDYRRNRGLINYDFTTQNIHRQEGFLIGMWTEFPNNAIDVRKINLVHNIKTGCQHSGFNVYINNGNLVCDFAVVSVSGSPTPISTIIKKSITGDAIDFLNAGRKCLFLENYQRNGHSTGNPFARIRLADEMNYTICEYYLAERNTGVKFSGEYFLFKDPTKQNGIGNLSFGINDWEDYKQGLVYTSPIKWGSIAVWEKDGEGDNDLRYRSFGRNDTNELEEFYNFASLKYKDNLKNDLFAWWDSDLNIDNGLLPSVVGRDSSSIIYNLQLTGSAYVGLRTDSSFNRSIINYSDYSIPTPKTPIPFGGFPGTDKYGH